MSTPSAYADLSFWWRSIGAPAPRPSLTGDVRADIAIVGAGYSGMWTAYYLKELDPGLDIALIDAEVAGFGAAGRNGGWCSLNLPNFEVLAQKPKYRDAAIQIAPHLFDMVEEVGRVCQREGIDAHYQKGGVLHVPITEKQKHHAQAAIDAYAGIGFEEAQVWLGPEEAARHVRIAGALGGVYSPHCAVVHPARLARGLSNVLEQKGVRIFENSPATDVQAGRVTTLHGSLNADKIVVATEGYSRRVRQTEGRLSTIHSFLIVTEPLPQSVFDEIGLDQRQAFADGRGLVTYGQRTADNRIAFGYGASYLLGSRAQDRFSSGDSIFRTLQNILVQLFPVLQGTRIDQCWGGPMGMAVNGQAFVQYDGDQALGWVGGFLGNGVAATNLGGRTMAERLLGQDTERTALTLLNRSGDPLKAFQAWPPEPLRWIGINSWLKKLRFDDWRDAG